MATCAADSLTSELTCCAVIPAYNEGKHIADVVRRVKRYLHDVWVIDDGSSDDTSDVASSAGAEVVRFERNRGKGVALIKGLQLAGHKGFDAAFTLDADGQHLPEEMPRFIDKMTQTGADIVLGNRLRNPKEMPLHRRAVNRSQSLLLSILGGPGISDTQTGYRLIRPRVVMGVKYSSSRYAFESEILIRAARRGFRFAEVPISCVYGDEQSTIRPARDTLRFLRMLVKVYR
ncbi:MAG: glycosyltransferase family 2 protein [Planctomycetota bacterium]|nr:MAG: glycosyltransferase family 2 protein [Planctomycetota bacterium]